MGELQIEVMDPLIYGGTVDQEITGQVFVSSNGPGEVTVQAGELVTAISVSLNNQTDWTFPFLCGFVRIDGLEGFSDLSFAVDNVDGFHIALGDGYYYLDAFLELPQGATKRIQVSGRLQEDANVVFRDIRCGFMGPWAITTPPLFNDPPATRVLNVE